MHLDLHQIMNALNAVVYKNNSWFYAHIVKLPFCWINLIILFFNRQHFFVTILNGNKYCVTFHGMGK